MYKWGLGHIIVADRFAAGLSHLNSFIAKLFVAIALPSAINRDSFVAKRIFPQNINNTIYDILII